MTSRALLPVLAAAALLASSLGACASLKEAPDGADADGGPPGSSGGNGDGAADPDGTGSLPGSEGGPSGKPGAGNGDPRWPQWPTPADAPDDASYMLTNGADGAIVVDKVTGLAWQDTVPTTMRDFDGATAYCDALVYDGQSDWRLPTRIEAISIMSFKPGFDETTVAGPAFSSVSGAVGQCFWTSSRLAQSTTSAFAVTVAAVSGMQTTSTCVARCVRGGAALGAPIAKQFVLTADTVTDPTTGLVWEKTPPETEGPYANAEARCKALVLGGRTMRLPTVKELASIVDETKRDPASNGAFGDYSVRMYTSIPRWTVEFGDGSAVQGPTGFSYWSRCVAGP
ncbi:MAG: putative secreted protein [Labilithrix sp.]|nr:putative secreted protein [Labilithrix sp.]